MYGVQTAENPVGNDKVLHLYARAAVFESGNVLLFKGSMAAGIPTELAVFPGGKFDDQVDSTTQALETVMRVLRIPAS